VIVQIMLGLFIVPETFQNQVGEALLVLLNTAKVQQAEQILQFAEMHHLHFNKSMLYTFCSMYYYILFLKLIFGVKDGIS
jgi:hypothetical protein